jgi:hypothetical protein
MRSPTMRLRAKSAKVELKSGPDWDWISQDSEPDANETCLEKAVYAMESRIDPRVQGR